MPRTGDDWLEPPPAPPGDTIVETVLVRAVNALGHNVRNLAEVVQSDRRLRRLLVWLVGIVVVSTLIQGAVGGLILWRYSTIVTQNHRNGRILIECTTPGVPGAKSRTDRVHECYDAAQENQRRAVGQIVDANRNGVIDTEEIIAILQNRPKPSGG